MSNGKIPKLEGAQTLVVQGQQINDRLLKLGCLGTAERLAMVPRKVTLRKNNKTLRKFKALQREGKIPKETAPFIIQYASARGDVPCLVNFVRDSSPFKDYQSFEIKEGLASLEKSLQDIQLILYTTREPGQTGYEIRIAFDCSGEIIPEAECAQEIWTQALEKAGALIDRGIITENGQKRVTAAAAGTGTLAKV